MAIYDTGRRRLRLIEYHFPLAIATTLRIKRISFHFSARQ
jgi:hypothetical protein